MSMETRWSLAAAAFYAFAGGYADAAGYLLVRTFTGHVTGNLVLLALALLTGHAAAIAPRVLAVAGFSLATGAGFRLSASGGIRSLAVSFAVQALLLLPAGFAAARMHPWYLILALSLALGIQNGVVTSIGGVSLHTTFLSGDVTSLIAKWARPRAPNPAPKPAKPETVPVLSAVAACFFLGALAAGALHPLVAERLPALLPLPLAAAAFASGMGVRLRASAQPR